MNERLTYKLFTIADLEDWLVHNKANGITDRIISRARAYAFINNPHAKKEDAVIAAVFDGDVAIGYTAAYAEKWVRPVFPERYFWGSTQWLEPEYRGKGASWNMMRQIKDAVNDRYVALDSSIASCKLDKKQGYKILYYPRYFFVLDASSRGIKALCKRLLVSVRNRKALHHISRDSFTNRYVSFIDDATYSFIEAHSDGDLFLRKQDYLNWQMRYPFLVATNGDNNAEKETCEFGSYVNRQFLKMVQVYVSGALCGFYVLNTIDEECKPLYLYYDETYKDDVFTSLVFNVFANTELRRFSTFSDELYQWMKKKGIVSLFSKSFVEQISFTVPAGFSVDLNAHVQCGDGDMM